MAQDPQTDSTDGGEERRRYAVAAGLICLIVASAYVNSLWNGFAFDDLYIVVDNPLIRSFSHIPTLFSTHYWEGAAAGGQELSLVLYRPLVLVSYTLNYMTSGLQAWAFHLTNILLHLGVVLTLYGVGRRLGLQWPGALTASLVFAAHPLNTEAVTGIVGRAELMMALGVLLALYWDLGKNAPRDPVARISPASIAAFAVGLFSKEQAILLPALLVVVDSMRGEATDARGRLSILWTGRARYLGYLALATVYLFARTAVIGTKLPYPSSIENPLSVLNMTTSLINAVKVAGVYLWRVIWPANLSADYSYNALATTDSVLDPAVWCSALAWGALLTLGAVALAKRDRPLAIGIAIVFLFFLPVANIVTQIGTIMGERLFYLPLAGICLALGAGWDRAAHALCRASRSGWCAALGVGTAFLILLPMTMRTIMRNRDWESNETLFASMVVAQPGSAKAHFLMAGVHHRRGQLEKALRQYETALAILPGYKKVPSFARKYGSLLMDLGKVDEAVAMMEEAVQVDPVGKDLFIHRMLSAGYERKNDLARAVTSRKRAIEIARSVSGTSVSVLVADYGELARLYALQGHTEAGRRILELSLRLVREDRRLAARHRAGISVQILGNLALIDVLDGDYERAEAQYLESLKLLESPALRAQTRLRMRRLRDYAALLRKMGRSKEAAAVEQKAGSLGLP